MIIIWFLYCFILCKIEVIFCVLFLLISYFVKVLLFYIFFVFIFGLSIIDAVKLEEPWNVFLRFKQQIVSEACNGALNTTKSQSQESVLRGFWVNTELKCLLLTLSCWSLRRTMINNNKMYTNNNNIKRNDFIYVHSSLYKYFIFCYSFSLSCSALFVSENRRVVVLLKRREFEW